MAEITTDHKANELKEPEKIELEKKQHMVFFT